MSNIRPANLHIWLLLLACTFIGTRCERATNDSDDDEVSIFLKKFNRQAQDEFNRQSLAAWEFNTNITDENEDNMNKANGRVAEFINQQAEEAAKFNIQDVWSYQQRRELLKIANVGVKLNRTESIRLSEFISNMKRIFESKICSWNSTTKEQDCNNMWSLDPHLYGRLAASRDFDELNYIWTEWRSKTASIKPLYEQFVELSNKGARNGGFDDTGDYWRSRYETANFEEAMQKALYKLLPIYEQLHAYVRRKLLVKYPDRFDSSAIPAHLTGNMWSQAWSNTFDFTRPYADKPSVDVTAEMQRQSYTALKMFQLSDKFFSDMGLKPMPESFYQKSMIEKPLDRDVVCYASAWDFYKDGDVRIKQCTSVTQDDLVTVHHEMGHIEYYLQYAHQPVVFRRGANNGFHEAIGDTLALAVSTPAHLKKINLLPEDFVEDDHQDINYLFRQALDKIAFLPFGYVIDAFRWRVFDGTFAPTEWNDKWVELRKKFQGILPPVLPRPEDAFDAAAKFHVPNNTPYIRFETAQT